MYHLIKELGEKVKSNELTWEQAAKSFNNQTNLNLTGNALRKRFSNLKEDTATMTNEVTNEEYEMHYANGSVELQKEIWFDSKEKKTPESVLLKFGYDPNEWILQSWRFGKWEVAIKDEQTNRVCTTIRAVIKPLLKTELKREDYMKIIQEEMKKVVKPLKLLSKPKQKGLDEDKLLLIPSIEAHLGKLSNKIDTNEEYDHKIVIDRCRKVFNDTIALQNEIKAETCLMVIGGDFFNSESNNMTTGGTPQQNDTRYKKMFAVGLNIYKEAIISLRDNFDRVDVKLCAGNHARAMEFFLYMALQQYFTEDETIKFSDNYKDTQSYVFGECGLFFNHGDINLKRLEGSIPAEFYKEYGQTKYRYLFLGHLHKQDVITTNNGLTIYRIPAICENDEWHYRERYGLGTIPQHEIVVLDKNYGVISTHFINFEDSKKKVLTKER